MMNYFNIREGNGNMADSTSTTNNATAASATAASATAASATAASATAASVAADNDAKNVSTSRNTGTGGFVLGLIIPLVVYYFVTYKLYSSSFSDDVARVNVSSKVGVFKMLLLAVIFISMYALNTKQMKQMCPNGSQKIVTKVFFSTFIPFIFMLGSVVVAITVMPGWKAPFSNTIGYSLVKNVIFRKLFQLQDWLDFNVGSGGNEELKKFNRRSNRTFFVNELTPENFHTAVDSLGLKFADDGIKKQLYQAVIIKDSIAEFIWIFITSILTYSLSQIYIIDYSCEPDTDSLHNNVDAAADAEADNDNAEEL